MWNLALPLAGQVLGGILGRKSKAARDPYADQRNDLLARAKAVSERPYEAYTGERVAGFTPLQEQAFEGIGSLAYTPAEYTRQSFTDPGVMEQFMSPYQRGVTDIAKREFNKQADIARQRTAAAATQAGAWGDRYGLVQAEEEKNRQQGLADLEARGLQSAYDAAQKQFGFEAGQEQQRQYLQDLADRNAFAAQRSIYGDQIRAGGMQQDLAQKGLDVDYGAFKERRDYPMQSLQDYASIFGKAVPTQAPSTTDWGSTGAGIGGLLGKAISGGGLGSLFGGSGAAAKSAMSGFNEYDWI